jgi:hypothetical protein
MEWGACRLFAVTVPLAISGYARAADAPAACPSGNVAIIRIRTIAPKGPIAGFEKAAADHAKWYASHGYNEDRIVAAPVLLFDAATSKLRKSPDTVISFHYHSHDVPNEKHDKAWDAYVAEYNANSEIKSTTLVCIPR